MIPLKLTASAIPKDALDKKEGKYDAYGNDLLKIITIFNYTQLILIFTSLRHFTKRFERVNKSDGRFY